LALAGFWYIRGRVSEGRAWLEEALSSPAGPRGLRAKAMLQLSNLLDSAGEYTKAEELAHEGVELYRKLEIEPKSLWAALNQHANVLLNLDQYDRAKTLHQEALALARKLGDARRIGQTLNNLAYLAYEQHDDEGAARLAQESLAQLRNEEDAFLRCTVLHTCGVTALRNGNDAHAARFLHESLSLAHDVGSAELSADCFTAIAALTMREDPARAAQILGRAEALLEEGGLALSRPDSELFTSTVNQLEEHVGKASSDAARAAGRLLEAEAGVELALRSLE
jgi:tetratricopeptide (TPR) repeat protein